MSGGGNGPARLLIVLGPTATGKSALALALAERLEAEIVGCDALQLYRGLDAGTGKPAAWERRLVPHHLVDCIDARTDYSLAEYVRAAERAIEEIAARGRVPIVVGGTGLYLRGLLRGVIPAPPRDAALRRRLTAIAARGRGLAHLRAWLARADAASARRIPSGDRQRTLRAIELARGGGPTWSTRLATASSWASGRERYPALKIGLEVDREELARRIDARVDRFFEAGLVEEVRALLADGTPPEANAFKAIGYREVLAAIVGGEDPQAVRDTVKRSTRRYAKRQQTWLRAERGIVWFDAAGGVDGVVDRVVARWRAVLYSAPTAMPPRREQEETMETETRNLQNDFFNAVRKERSIVTVFLGNGKKLTGRIKSFDKFTLLLESPHGEQIVFKHAISTVSASARGDEAPAD